VVSPFKTTESEQVWQYAKLLQKIRTGAHFIITQLGYDVCKFEEFVRFMNDSNINTPVLGNIFIPSFAVAQHMADGQVPGVIFPKELLRRIEAEYKSQNREARLVRAAKQICVLKGLGYAGVHIGGTGLNFDDIRFVLDTAEELEPDWGQHRTDVHFPVKDSWYLYPPTEIGSCGAKRVSLKPGRLSHTPLIHKFMHRLLFTPGTFISNIFGQFCLFCAKTRQGTAFLRNIESGIKGFIFYCRMCGDCTLPESTYICPQAGCPKKLLNGPCGGSREKTCEVFPDRYCFWARVYNRVDQSTTLEDLSNLPYMPPKNWALDQTSSWINFYQGKDHKKISFTKKEK
jgi:methylenetetrahydrofolate reductase (NADPH)